jgi:hypothetical protein
MTRYYRDALAVVLPSGRVLTQTLPLRPEGEDRRLEKLTDVIVTDHDTGALYVYQYTGYYIISPGSFEKIKLPPPAAPARFDLPDESDEPRATHDLLPCPVTLVPYPGLRVCVESHLKSATFIEPTRARPGAMDHAAHLVPFGEIHLPPGGERHYDWRTRIEQARGVRRLFSLLNGGGYDLLLLDRGGEHKIGTWRPAAAAK